MTDTRLDKLFYEIQGIKADTIRIIEMLSERSKEIAKVELKKEPVEITNTVKEEIEQDFTQVQVSAQSDKALLVVKKGYQQWLAKSLIVGGGSGYDEGNIYDIKIVVVSPKSGKSTKWVFSKWEVFKVVKKK